MVQLIKQMDKAQKKGKSRELTLAQFVWYGFFFTAGSLSFAGGLFPTSQPAFSDSSHKFIKEANPHAIGLHLIWVVLLTGLVAMAAALVFSKLSRVHYARKNGLGYIYSRSAFGRLVGFMIGLYTYAGLPFLITVQILFFIRGYFGGGFIGHADPRLVVKWGDFTNLWLDLISIFIYLAVALTVFIGIRVFKLISSSCIILNCFLSLFSIGIYFLLFINHAHESFNWWNRTPKINSHGAPVGGGNVFHITGIFYAFNVFFFYFAGFEQFGTDGRNLKNPSRTLSAGIKIVMSMVVLWMVFFTVIFFGSYWGDSTNQKTALRQSNFINFWGRKELGGLHSGWYYFGITVTIIGEFLFVIRMSSENSFYGGTILQPLAEEGYIPEKLTILAKKDNFPKRASAVNLIITTIVIFIWLVIPDIIIGTLKHSGKKTGVLENVFGLGAFLSTSSFYTVIVYAAGVFALLKLFFQKKVELSWIQVGYFASAALFLTIPIFYYFYESYRLFATKQKTSIISGSIQLFFLILVTGLGLLIYRFYYYPKYCHRMRTSPGLQKKLDAQFAVLDDWQFLGARLEPQLKRYLVRNQVIYGNKSNANYHLVQDLINQFQDSLAKQTKVDMPSVVSTDPEKVKHIAMVKQ